MSRLKFSVALSPSAKIRRLRADDPVSFIPMDAIKDGLGGVDGSRAEPLNVMTAGSYNFVANDDVLLAKVTPCFENGKKGRAEGLINGVGFATSEVYVLRPDASRIDPDFLLYLLSSEDFRFEGIRSMTGAGGLKRVSAEAVRNYHVNISSPEDQVAIARFLDRETGMIDGLIEKKTRFIALLKEKEKAAISRLVRRGLDRNAPTIDSGVDWRGRVPAHWVRGRMKDHFRQEKRQGYEDLTVLSVYREFGVIEKSSRDDNINKTPEDLSKYQLVNPNDLVINKMKAWQGSMGIAPMKGITSPDYVVMRPIGEHDPRYMHHYLRAQPMPWVYRLISNGIRTDQWRMEPEKFLGLPVYIPPIEEQRLIAERIDVELERIRGLISLTESSIDLLREKRAALITAAVTGKIDVRAAA
ncbi:restriction endonuclease subunit S [Salipiger sp. PrR002]|uniref:restriction endonuclease subunit S n=1 Tax=Salipiger sp. PrR002 TaxID=2706489 RepID=UPI0013BE10D0|nr:restriction endonuclease subunit S [Salipiger sp. PrR002]NDW02320.1 restriction endonuclease subunit S [Salipiger sp. PrR002]NDW59392.1 restriction endonuclease subunit S [Salipiger sp. PrR004]